MSIHSWQCQLHNHTTLCDGEYSPAEMAAAALAQGVRVFGFSGHSHTPHDESYCMSVADTARYRAEVERLQKEYAGRMEILCGIEWDSFSDDDPAAYDYWIGSVHDLHCAATGRYYTIDWKPELLAACRNEAFDGDALALAEAYFASVGQLAQKKPTILGHFDLLVKLNAGGAFFDETAPRYREAALGALALVDPAATLLEINTGGMARGYRDTPYPADFILRAWRDMGGQIVLTSDAHQAKNICYGIPQATAAARAAGYREATVFVQGQRRLCALDAV